METKQYRIAKNGDLVCEFVSSEVLEAYDALALEALGECRTSIAMALRFLNAALWHMPFEREVLRRTLAVAPQAVRYDPENVVNRYRGNPDELVRDCLHAVLHCVFHHPFDKGHEEFDTWSVACDIAVELCALEMCGSRFPSEADAERRAVARRLREIAQGLTAPALYRVLRHGAPGERLYVAHGLTGDDIAELAALFARDAHDSWAGAVRANSESQPGPAHAAVPDLQAQGDGADSPSSTRLHIAGDSVEGAGGEAPSARDAADKLDSPDPEADSADATDPDPDPDADVEPDADADADRSRDDNDDSPGRDAPDDGDPEGPADREGLPEADADSDDGASPPRTGGPDAAEDFEERALEEWRRISKRVEAEMRSHANRSTGGEGGMLQNLAVANRKAANYDEFLKRFATLGEDLRVNDDEFDYVFYTYGLARYGNVPLVEPLEYVESNRVREFAIVIDTSGSCSGRLVREFVERTYSILRQQTSFGDEMNVHIVQCDNRVRTATKVTSLRQLEEYSESFWVSGGGGTDFKPAFAYVDSLVEAGEFGDLRGLIYFTDGFGSFPVKAPDYEVAFVFVDVEGSEARIPPWAMKVVMTQEEVLEKQESRR